LATGSGAWGAADLGGAYQLSFTAADATNSYTSKSMSVTFTGTSGNAVGHSLSVGGYWNGSTSWGARFAPTQTGTWSYTTSSADSGLNAKSGTVTVTAPTVKSRLQVRPDAPKYLQRVNGDPYMVVGDTLWRGLWTASSEDANPAHYATDAQYQAAMNTRATQGFNYVHMTVAKFNGVCSLNGAQPFTYSGGKPNPDTLNPAFFQQMDARVQYAASKGIVVSLINSWADHGYWNDTTDTQSNRIDQYLINRYGAYPMIWMGLGEYDEDYYTEAQASGMADYYRTHDPYRNPVTLHPTWGAGTLPDPQNHLDIYTRQQDTDCWLVAANSHTSPGIPYMNAEYGYEGSISATEVLKRSWQLVMGGSTGLVYGNQDWWANNNAAALNSTGAGYMANLGKFWQDSGTGGLLETLRYWEFDSFSRLDAGAGRYEAKQIGGQRVIWSETAGTFSINLSDLPECKAKWFNARTGVWGEELTLLGGGTTSVTAPDAYYALFISEPDPPPIPGDANGDRVVNDKDASILGKNWLVQSGASWSMGDFNNDKKVNDADAAILAAHWGETAAKGASVPEPSTVALLLGALVSLFVWRQRGLIARRSIVEHAGR
jgi:hypothetical protein